MKQTIVVAALLLAGSAALAAPRRTFGPAAAPDAGPAKTLPRYSDQDVKAYQQAKGNSEAALALENDPNGALQVEKIEQGVAPPSSLPRILSVRVHNTTEWAVKINEAWAICDGLDTPEANAAAGGPVRFLGVVGAGESLTFTTKGGTLETKVFPCGAHKMHFDFRELEPVDFAPAQ